MSERVVRVQWVWWWRLSELRCWGFGTVIWGRWYRRCGLARSILIGPLELRVWATKRPRAKQPEGENSK